MTPLARRGCLVRPILQPCRSLFSALRRHPSALKQVATEGGVLAERGRLPDDVHQRSRMNVTSLLHGSFGFVLEEDSEGQLGMFESPAHRAVQSVNSLLEAVSAIDGRVFDERLHDLDVRIFQTLKRFVGTLHKSHATMRIAEEERELKLDFYGVERAFDRMARVSIFHFAWTT
jgi:hypothetical protein